MHPIALGDVLDARRRIAPYLQPTPLLEHPALCEAVGTRVLVKHENMLPTGAFKVRGGVNLVSRLSDGERAAGVIAASTGNHGQSVAYAARLFGVRAIICVPRDANPVKLGAMRALGAEIVEHGRDYDEAREHCEALALSHGYRYVHSGNEPLLIAGVGTATLEALERAPDADVVIVPVGGGSGASGACVVCAGVGGVRVIGVQSSAAPSAFESWRSGTLVSRPMETFAEGLQTRTAFELPQSIMRALLDDFVLVDDEAIREAMRLYLMGTRNLIEAAGAAPLAAAMDLRDRLRGQTVVLIASGGNVSPDQVRELL